MPLFLHTHIQELKIKVLEFAQINKIIAADCYKLALDISDKTQQTISQTTIKRVYGFAQARYAPSSFTLNVLSQYCGYESWTDFVDQIEMQKKQGIEHYYWNNIAQVAHNITRFTLQTNKRKSGLSYRYTIDRQPISQHIQQFLQSKATTCIISALSGMGKTIGITRWVDEQLAINHAEKRNDIFLFVTSSSLFFAAYFGFDSNKWLAQLLNFSPLHFAKFLTSYEKNAPGKLYIIIDDFNHNMTNNRTFSIIFKQMIDIVVHLSNYSWIKFIITMRPSTWQKYGNFIENNKEISKLWFTNFVGHGAINLPPFSTQEIQQLMDKVPTAPPSKTCDKVPYFSTISTPLYFQYYYQLKGSSIRMNIDQSADEYAIISIFLRKKILKGALASEKQLLLNQLSFFIDLSTELPIINKKQVYPIIKENHPIYDELLHDGLIYEHQEGKGTRATYQIRFKSLVIAAYFIAQSTFELYENKAEKPLIDWLTHNNYPEKVKIALLKWFILFSLECGDLTVFNYIQGVAFITPYQASLISYTCNNLDYVMQTDPSITSVLNQSLASSGFIDIALDHLLTEPAYQQALKKLLQYPISVQQKILLHTSFAFSALLCLNDQEALKHIEALKAIPYPFYANFPLNPLLIMENIYHYYRYHVLKDEAFDEIQLFCANPERGAKCLHNQLIYTLGYIILKLKATKTIETNYLQIIYRHNLRGAQKIMPNFKASILLAMAEKYLITGQKDVAILIRNKVQQLYSTHIVNSIQRGLLDMELLRRAGKDYLHLAGQLILMAKKYNLKYFEAKIRIYLIHTLHPQVHRDLIHEQQKAIQTLFAYSDYQLESFYNLLKATLISSSTVS
ncbi:hypothetical protein GCM10023231_03960 [Olivibacter ginsenosidimutans]|uniref:NACHT domain-containing protein n=1 Tax=Olivibacter ginsenosidimutans TaxID=1176537 RepID=A0ABP9AEX9_9SPHI